MGIVDIFPTLESDLAELEGLCSAKNGTKLRSLENNAKQTDKCVACFLGSAGCMADLPLFTVSWHWKLSAHMTLKYVFDLVCHCQSKRTLRVVQTFKLLSQRGKKISAVLVTISFFVF